MTLRSRALLDGQRYHADPYPLFAQLTAAGTIHPVDFPAINAWLVTGHDAAKRALTDPRLRKDHRKANAKFRANASLMPEPQRTQLQSHLLHRDPPQHSRMRSLIVKHFTTHRSESQRSSIRADVNSLVDSLPPMADKVPVDIAGAFASKLPMIALARAVGLPDHLRDQFDPSWRSVVSPVPPHHPDRHRYERLLTELQHYIAEVVNTAPPSSLLGTLVSAAASGDITLTERNSMIFQLFAAGQDPVTAQLELALIALFDRPQVLCRLIREPERVVQALEELLRFDAAFNLTTWRFLAHNDRIDGTNVPAGDSIIIALGAANRDRTVFEQCDDLLIDRNPNPHLTFGYGPHSCPAAAFARIELQEALSVLITRLIGLQPAYRADELQWSPSPITRGVEMLPVYYRQRVPRQ